MSIHGGRPFQCSVRPHPSTRALPCCDENILLIKAFPDLYVEHDNRVMAWDCGGERWDEVPDQ